MGRKIQCGFETGDTNQEGSDTTNSGTLSQNVVIVGSAPTPRSGTFCLKTWIPTSSSATLYARKRFAHANLSEVWYAFGVYPHVVTEVANTSVIFRTFDDANNANLVIVYDAGILRAYYAFGTVSNNNLSNLTLIGATSTTLAQDAWHLVEIHHIPNIGAGTLRIYTNGTLALEVIGGRTANVNNYNHEFDIGFNRASSPTAGGTATFFAWDDIRVNDVSGAYNNGRPGDGKILPIIPMANGTYVQLSPSAGANFDCVNEVPPNTSDFVSSSTVGQKDTYNLTDLVNVGNIQAVNHILFAQNADGGGGSVGFLLRSGGVDAESAPQPITASWTYYKNITEVDPTDGLPWNTAKINAVEAGVVVR